MLVGTSVTPSFQHLLDCRMINPMFLLRIGMAKASGFFRAGLDLENMQPRPSAQDPCNLGSGRPISTWPPCLGLASG